MKGFALFVVFAAIAVLSVVLLYKFNPHFRDFVKEHVMHAYAEWMYGNEKDEEDEC